MAALQGLQWSTYYEGFRGDTALAPATNYLANMREEARRGVAAVVHSYYKATPNPNPNLNPNPNPSPGQG